MHNKQTVNFKDPMHFRLIVVNKSLRLAWIYVNICNFVKYFDPPTLQFRHQCIWFICHNVQNILLTLQKTH